MSLGLVVKAASVALTPRRTKLGIQSTYGGSSMESAFPTFAVESDDSVNVWPPPRQDSFFMFFFSLFSFSSWAGLTGQPPQGGGAGLPWNESGSAAATAGQRGVVDRCRMDALNNRSPLSASRSWTDFTKEAIDIAVDTACGMAVPEF